MTNPGGENFQVGEDTVVAKLSVDVPAGSAESLRSINQQAEQLKVNLESVARAQSSWLEYLAQIPQLTEQAASAQRNLITQLERTSYIQQQLGGAAAGGAGGAGGGPAPYSTAAPQGYVDPFAGMTAGMRGGVTGGGLPPSQQGAAYMQMMMQQDPRLAANMAAQRGMTPVTMGMGGAGSTPVSGGGMGQGAGPPASMAPQASQKSRDAASPPDSGQSGQPMTSEPQNIPSSPHPEAPGWQQSLVQAASMGRSLVNETRSGFKAGGVKGAAGAAVGALGGGGGGGGGQGQRSGGGDDGGGGGLGGLLGAIPTSAKVAGGAGLLLGGGMLLNKVFQNAGEQIQQYRNLGAERGGGAVEGAGYELQAAQMAMNPFITMEQSRQIMQSALKSGYTGKQFDTVTGFMAENLKNMNMSVADSVSLLTTNVDKGKMTTEELATSLAGLKDLSKTGQKGLTQRTEEYKNVSAQLSAQGLEGPALDISAKTVGEMFAGDRVLKDAATPLIQAGLGNSNFLVQCASISGVTGWTTPEAIIPIAQEMGIGPEQLWLNGIKHLAKQASGQGGKHNNVAMFKTLMGQNGMALGTPEAKALYNHVMGGGADEATEARERVTGETRTGKKKTEPKAGSTSTGPRDSGGGDTEEGGGWANSWLGKVLKKLGGGAPFEETAADAETEAAANGEGGGGNRGGGGIRPSGSNARPEKKSAEEARASGPSTSKGTVNGELRVTVDQQGRVTAPPTVRLTGNQITVNAGYGSATMNNPSPADQGNRHQTTGMG